jgi:hypothetical protein
LNGDAVTAFDFIALVLRQLCLQEETELRATEVVSLPHCNVSSDCLQFQCMYPVGRHGGRLKISSVETFRVERRNSSDPERKIFSIVADLSHEVLNIDYVSLCIIVRPELCYIHLSVSVAQAVFNTPPPRQKNSAKWLHYMTCTERKR